MSLDTPTTNEIYASIISQIEAAIGQTVPLLPKAFIRVLAKALAGVFILLYKYAGFIFLQIFVATATNNPTTINGVIVRPLTFWGRLFGVGDPVNATNAELQIDITVVNQVGSLASGTQLTSNKNQVIYSLKNAVLLDAATVVGEVVAIGDPEGTGGAGVQGNLDPGDTLSFVTPLADVLRDTEVTAQLVTAADGETDDAYRQRVQDRAANQPQGGAYADYEQWGEEVAGIINTYPYAGAPGEVDVYSEATPASSGSPDGIPTQAQLDAVAESIELNVSGLATRRPVTAFVNSLPITRTGFDVTVEGLSVSGLAEVQSEIETAITLYFTNREPFIDGLTRPPRTDRITENDLIAIVTDSVSARNGTFDSVTMTLAGSPTILNTYTLNEGEKAKLSSIAWA